MKRFGWKASCRYVCFAAALVALLAAAPVFAQNETPFTFNVGGGFTPVVGALGTRLDNGWHFTLGAGYNFKGFSALGRSSSITGSA